MQRHGEVDVFVLGCGYMGQNAVRCLLDATTEQRLGFIPRFRALIDYNPYNSYQAASIFSEYPNLQRLTKGCLNLSTIEDAMPLADPNHRIFFYDAGLAQARPRHFVLFRKKCPDGVFLGEKPFAISEAELRTISTQLERDSRVFCNFTETFGEAFRVFSNRFRQGNVLSIKFARSSCIGIRIALDEARPGITEGGSLFDRGVHAVALSRELLGEGWVATVRSASFGAVAIHPDFLQEREALLTVLGSSTPYITKDPQYAVADGSCEFEIDWVHPTEPSVLAQYVTSWFGSPRSIAAMISAPSRTALAREQLPWLRSQEIGLESMTRMEDEEVRFITASAGDRELIASLMHFKEHPSFVAERKGNVLERVWTRENRDDYLMRKQWDLAELISQVVTDPKTSALGGRTILETHRTIFEVQARALHALHNEGRGASELFLQTLRLCQPRLTQGFGRSAVVQAIKRSPYS